MGTNGCYRVRDIAPPAVIAARITQMFVRHPEAKTAVLYITPGKHLRVSPDELPRYCLGDVLGNYSRSVTVEQIIEDFAE